MQGALSRAVIAMTDVRIGAHVEPGKVTDPSAHGRDGNHVPTYARANHPVSGFPLAPIHSRHPPLLSIIFPERRTRNQEQPSLNHATHLPLNLVAFLASRSVSLALSLAAISDFRTSARRTPRSLASGDIFDSNSVSLSPARTFFWAGLLG
jgi:hypothetical protein